MKTALVTGASSGFGLLASVELARQGFTVFATMRDVTRARALERTAISAGVSVHVLPLDVTQDESVQACVDAVKARTGRLDVVVNNAGVAVGGFFEDQSDDEVRGQFETNFFGVLRVLRAVLPLLRAQQGGRIINVSSMGGRIGTPGLAPYCATKFALEGLTESLRHEVGPLGIDVVLVEPGTYGTSIFYGNRQLAARATSPASPYAKRFQSAQEAMLADITKRNADPRDVAVAIARAATARRPRLRYVVGADATVGAWAQRLLPEGWFLTAVRRFFEPA